jgi:integration host factor subunit alpha
MAVTEAEIAGRICEKSRISNGEAINIVEATFEIIKASLQRGEPVKISGFGGFVVRTRQPRKGRNPQTGAEIVIPERRVLTFKPSALMRKTVETTQLDSTI